MPLQLHLLTSQSCSVCAGISQALSGAQLRAGQRVLIHAGSGGVGTMAIQIAKLWGAYVVTTCSTAKSSFVQVYNCVIMACLHKVIWVRPLLRAFMLAVKLGRFGAPFLCCGGVTTFIAYLLWLQVNSCTYNYFQALHKCVSVDSVNICPYMSQSCHSLQNLQCPTCM